MQENQSVEECQAIADDLMLKLAVAPADLLTGAYMDLILNGKGPGGDSWVHIVHQSYETLYYCKY